MSLMGFLIAGLVGLAIMAIFAGILSILPRDNISDRMQEVFSSDLAADTGGSGAKFSANSSLKLLDKKLQSRGLGHTLTANLMQADLKLTATEYALLVVSITILGALLGYLISRHPVSALITGTISFFSPAVYVTWRKIKRRREFADQLVDVITQIVGSLRSGYSLVQSLDTVSKQAPPPAGEEFLRVVREVQLGLPLQVALEHLAERIENEDLVMVITAINVNQQIGGNLAEILDTAAETIRERVRIKREIQVLTAQQTISGYVLVFLPIALGAILMVINPTYQMKLFTPGLTLCIPTGAALGIVIGFFAMRRIIDIEV
ncbi:MAG TPA: type II secretion system F family protein [Anaerolineae bacterium]|nr:type II secretion system F family protein [Anaerolineae bacterium]MCB0181439.1 type II secretion system F family protein [Anaerolineae bacterium]MCB0222284.1 type II secretion system F family protein [Anaerolineae bacterium]MCB9103834.1 type II secretion system F family protein [Anaerolineales bacterium]HRV96259.1 type II secretion system F family protein [Anaerolineae bacterium]